MIFLETGLRGLSKKNYYMNKNIIFVFGNFNILHPGHLRLFQFIKSLKKEVYIGLIPDKDVEESVFINEILRKENLDSNSLVDKCLIIENSIEETIMEYKPYAVVKGKEYENAFNPELKILESYGGKLIFSSGDVVFSSKALLKNELGPINNDLISVPMDFLKRHKINFDNITNIIEGFSKIKVLVIGDLILDKYITCEPLGMSQEDPTIVVKPIDSKVFVGGAGIVALHGSALGSHVWFSSVSGIDEQRGFIDQELREIETKIFKDPNRPTILKERYRSKGKTLLRVSRLSENSIDASLQKKLLNYVRPIIKKVDMILFSDFNYGFLPNEVVNEVIKLGKKHKKIMIADSQSSSQIGDISRFNNMDLICATEREARISVSDKEIGLVQLAEMLQKKSCASNIFLKLGEEGTFFHVLDELRQEFITDKINALSNVAIDTAGAGDSMLIGSSLSLATGASVWESAYIGALCAAIQVNRIGNIPLQQKYLLNLIKDQKNFYENN